MLRQLHHRCWCFSAPGHPDGPHYRNDQDGYAAAAEQLIVLHQQLLAREIEVADVLVRDLWQRTRPCWTLRCSGCTQLLQSGEGQAHWPNDEAARYQSQEQGWNWQLELCPTCVKLVVPFRPRRGRLVGAHAAG